MLGGSGPTVLAEPQRFKLLADVGSAKGGVIVDFENETRK